MHQPRSANLLRYLHPSHVRLEAHVHLVPTDSWLANHKSSRQSHLQFDQCSTPQPEHLVEHQNHGTKNRARYWYRANAHGLVSLELHKVRNIDERTLLKPVGCYRSMHHCPSKFGNRERRLNLLLLLPYEQLCRHYLRGL